MIDAIELDEYLVNLGQATDIVAGLAVVGRLKYTKGFDDATMMREFCEEPLDTTYWPLADSRPRADRLEWAKE